MIRRLLTLLAGAFLMPTLTGCDILEPQRNDEPIVPPSLNGRPVETLGTITVSSKTVTFLTWDSGRIDGDVISLFVNGREILSRYELTATPRSIPVTLDHNGYNYVALFAHNEGDIPPNTAALAVNDGVTEQQLVLSANLLTNGAYNIIVN